jgi:hypothetical protein
MADAGIPHPPLPGRTDGGDLEPLAQFLLKGLLHGEGPLPPILFGGAKFHFIVVHQEIDWPRGAALEKEEVITGIFHIGAKMSPHIGIGIPSRGRRFGGEGGLSRAGDEEPR